MLHKHRQHKPEAISLAISTHSAPTNTAPFSTPQKTHAKNKQMAPRLTALLVALALFAASASALYIDPAEKCPPEAPYVECSKDGIDPCATVRCMADTQCVVNSCGESFAAV